MTLERVLDRVNQQLNRREIGFIAIVVTKWHALGIEAWLESARHIGYEESGVILLRPHSRFGVSVSPDDLPCAAADDRVELLDVELPQKRFIFGRFPDPVGTVFRYVRLLWHGSRRAKRGDQLPVLKVISPFRANFDILTMLDTASVLKRYRVLFVITDEGLASYFPERIWRYSRKAADTSKRHAPFFDQCREVLQTVKDASEDRLLNSFEQQVRFLFSVDEERALVPNPEIVADYRRVLDSNRWRVENSLIPRHGTQPVALFLTQAWGTNGELSTDAELSTIRMVAQQLRKTPYLLVLKLHPHDRAEKYGDLLTEEHVVLMESSKVLERVLPCLESTDIVVSYNSTALLTAATLYSIPAFSVGDCLLDRADTGQWFRDFHQEFRILARDQVRDFGLFEVPP